MPLPLLAIGAGLGAINSISKWFTGNKQGKLADQINPLYTPYQTSQYAKQNLGAVQNMFNGRMAGAADAERGIQAAQANQLANINRNATDSSTALALGNAAQGQAGESAIQLGAKEGQYKAGLLDNLQSAYGQLVGEDHMKYQDMMNKYQSDMAAKSALRESAEKNKFGAINDISSLGIKLGTGGLLGGGGGGLGIPTTGGMPTNLGQQATVAQDAFNGGTTAPQQFMGSMSPALSFGMMNQGNTPASQFYFRNKYFGK